MFLFAQTTRQVAEAAQQTAHDIGSLKSALIGAAILAGVSLITALGGVALAWANALKAKGEAAAAKAMAEVSNQRITNVSRHIANVDSKQTDLAKDVGQVQGMLGNGITPSPLTFSGQLIDKPKG